jgi:hypothetical protein
MTERPHLQMMECRGHMVRQIMIKQSMIAPLKFVPMVQQT